MTEIDLFSLSIFILFVLFCIPGTCVFCNSWKIIFCLHSKLFFNQLSCDILRKIFTMWVGEWNGSSSWMEVGLEPTLGIKELQKCILYIICMWSLFCSVWVYISLYFYRFFVFLNYRFLCFCIFGFLFLVLLYVLNWMSS